MCSALREMEGTDKQMRLVHTNRHGLELSRRLFEPESPGEDEILETGAERVEPKKVHFDRKFNPGSVEKVSPPSPFLPASEPESLIADLGRPHWPCLHSTSQPYPQSHHAKSTFGNSSPSTQPISYLSTDHPRKAGRPSPNPDPTSSLSSLRLLVLGI